MKYLSKQYFFILNLLVYAAITLLVISDSGMQVFILTTFGPHSRILRKIAFVLLFTKVSFTRYSKKEFLVLLPFTAIAIYNYTVCGNIYGLYNVLIVAAMKNIDYSVLFKCAFYSSAFTIVTLGILSFIGIGSAFSLTESFGRGAIETRYSFGLGHPNIWHQTFARCIVYFVLGFSQKLKWQHLSALTVLNYIAYKFTLSRTGLLSVSIFLILYILYKYLPKFMNFFITKFFITIGTLGIPALFIYACYALHTAWSNWAVNFSAKFTTGRLFQAVFFLRERPISLWGNQVPNDSVFDLGLLRMFYEYGYLCGIVFILLLILVFLYSLKNNYGLLTCVCVFVFLYSLYEAPVISRAPNNISVFFIALLLYPQLKNRVPTS